MCDPVSEKKARKNGTNAHKKRMKIIGFSVCLPANVIYKDQGDWNCEWYIGRK